MTLRNTPTQQPSSALDLLDGPRSERTEIKTQTRELLDQHKFETLKQIGEKVAAIFASIKSSFSNIFGLGGSADAETGSALSSAPGQSVDRNSNATGGLSYEQVMAEIARNPNLSFLSEAGGRQSIDSLMASGRRIDTNQINMNFNALADARVFPRNNGKLCCAFYVSNILGLSSEGSTAGGFGSVTNALIPGLIQRNLELNNNTGIILGYKNFIPGDVMAFQGTPEYGEGMYGHTAIVRDVFSYNGVRYMSIQHESTGIQVEFIPIDPPDADMAALEAAYNNPTTRASVPALESAYDYRGQRFPEFVRFLRNRGYYGDASLGRGRGAFAVRTQSIVNHQRLSQS